MMIALHTSVMVAVALLGRGPAEPPGTAPDIAATLEVLKMDKALADLDVSVAARCVDPNAVAVGLETRRLMNPASGTKLLTTAAALERFGPNHRFETTAYGVLDGDGRVRGPLVIRPAGDPTLQGKATTELASALAGLGIKAAPDGIILDLGLFPASDLPPAFDQKNADAAYRPAVPPLGTHDGAIHVTVKPGPKPGDPVVVTTQTSGRSIEIVNEATTAAGKGIGKLEVSATGAGPVPPEPGAPGGRVGVTRIIVKGELGAKAPAQGVRKRLHDPLGTALDELLRALRKAGIETPTLRVTRATVASPGPELGRFQSDTVARMIATINIHSNNYWAEALFRLIGRVKEGDPATWENAAREVKSALMRLGLKEGDFRIVNGSGLYDATHISAEAMTRLLAVHGGDSDNARSFRESLARAGESGTLKKRLKQLKGRLLGKTGTLDKAVSLSGFIDRQQGCRLAFSAMIEGELAERLPKVVAAIDRWVLALAAL